MERLYKHKVVRFLISGGSAAAVEYVAFVALTLATPILVANSISFACGFVVSFILNKKWVFASVGNSKIQLTRYFILALVNLAISTALIWILVDVAHVYDLIAKIAVMLVIACWNYVIFSRVIFKR